MDICRFHLDFSGFSGGILQDSWDFHADSWDFLGDSWERFFRTLGISWWFLGGILQDSFDFYDDSWQDFQDSFHFLAILGRDSSGFLGIFMAILGRNSLGFL